MNKFENAKIYKIVDNTSDMIYVGSTCKTLQQRLKKHENNFKHHLNVKYSVFISISTKCL